MEKKIKAIVLKYFQEDMIDSAKLFGTKAIVTIKSTPSDEIAEQIKTEVEQLINQGNAATKADIARVEEKKADGVKWKNLFDKTPILVINDDGLHERMRIRKIGLIKWEDIEKIKIKKDVLDNDFICIYFKEPEKYINNEKELKRIRLKGSNCNYGHVFFTSLYFKKQLKDVIESIQYYFVKYNDKTL